MTPPFSVTALDSSSERSSFESGVEPLDRYFRTQVSQDIKRRVAACFVATDAQGRIAGYYTLASASVLLAELPEAVVKKLPRYPSVPAVRMGRLAVDKSFKGKGLGAALLSDAMRRAVRAEIASYAFVVDAKDQDAAAFYAHHGFMALPDQALCMFIALATVKELIKHPT